MQTAPRLQAELQAGPHSPGGLWMGCHKRCIARRRGLRGTAQDIAKEPPTGTLPPVSGGSPDQPIRAVPERPSLRTQ
jgi:hypothetical protein